MCIQTEPGRQTQHVSLWERHLDLIMASGKTWSYYFGSSRSLLKKKNCKAHLVLLSGATRTMP